MQNQRSLAKDLLLTVIGAVISAININTFVYSGGLVPGGFSGVSLTLVRLAERYFGFTLNYSVLYILFNIFPTLLVFKYVSKRFTLKSLVYVVLNSVLVQVIPKIPVTDDMLLVSVFGGIIAGLSTSIVLRCNACGGGTDFISIYFAKKKQRSVWNELFIANACILLIAGAFLGWESALYSIIFQFVNTQIIKAFDDRYKRSSFIIISEKAQEIAQAIYDVKYHHSVTLFDAIGGYTGTKKTVLYTVVGDYEVNRLIATIHEIDPNAFINIDNNQRVIGNFHEKPF